MLSGGYAENQVDADSSSQMIDSPEQPVFVEVEQMSVNTKESEDRGDVTKYRKNLAAFFMFVLTNNFAYVVMLSAADQILAGQSEVNAAAVLLADIVPCMVVKYTAPLYMDRIPYWFALL